MFNVISAKLFLWQFFLFVSTVNNGTMAVCGGNPLINSIDKELSYLFLLFEQAQMPWLKTSLWPKCYFCDEIK